MSQLTSISLGPLHTLRVQGTNTTRTVTAATYSTSHTYTPTAGEGAIIRIATTGNIFMKAYSSLSGAPSTGGAEWLFTEGVHFIRYDSSEGNPYLFFRLVAAGSETVNIAMIN